LTTRAVPSRSFDAACRHLFRHLREPTELRRNPLVSAHFSEELNGAARVRSDAAIAGAIRETIRRCAEHCFQADRLEDEENALRRHAIVVESDLEGVPREALAAKLGISARHYTRLQHDIRRRVAVLLSSELPRKRSASAAHVGRAQSPLRQLADLAGSGSPRKALEQLSSVSTASGDAHVVAAALRLQALIRQRYVGDFAGANGAMLASRSVLEKLAAGDPSKPLIKAEIDLALVEIDIESGRNYDQAIQTSIEIAGTLAQTDEAARWLRLRALSFAAYGDFVMGKRAEALQFLRTALSDFGASKHAPAQERVELLLWTAIVLAEVGRYSESSRMLAEALLGARQAGLTLDEIRLDLALTMIALECGAVSAATERLFSICEQSVRLSWANLGAQAHVYLARAQMRAALPRPRDILASARRAMELNGNDIAVRIEAKVAESFARLLLRDVHGAERAARDANDSAAATGNRAGRGNALRELARVAHVQGRERDAKRTIMAAVEAGYSAGRPQQTAQALDLAAQIMQRPSYCTEACALRSTLALSAPTWSL
jgi:tetratricopeptide (TPR) repeat protein